jgi:NADH:ubiquinone oxidoreductase subunit 6 (subunit J)
MALATPRQQLRPVVLLAAFVVYLLAGHAVHPGETMHEAAMGAGICIVLVTLVVASVVGTPRPHVPTHRRASAPAPASLHPVSASPPRARASPQWLRRFLN